MVFINIEYFKFIVNIIQKEWRYKMIKSKTFVLALVLFSFGLIGLTACKSNLANNGEKRDILPGTNIVFRDDFNNQGSIPSGFWHLCLPEKTNENDPAWNRFFKNTEGYECVKVEDSILKLIAKKEKGPANLNYKTGGVWSAKNKYGIGTSIKIKAKLYREGETNFNVPSAFPAIWLYPLFTPYEWPATGEIDIMEWVDKTPPNNVYTTLHYNISNNISNNIYSTIGVSNNIGNVAEWHVYRLDWYSNNIVIYYDDREVFKYTNGMTNLYPFNDNYYNIILNASLQKTWGTPVESNDSKLPYELWIDWIEVSLIDKFSGQPIN